MVLDWSHVLTLVIAVGTATWALHTKLSTIVEEIQGLRLDMSLKIKELEGRVVKLEDAKAARRGRR